MTYTKYVAVLFFSVLVFTNNVYTSDAAGQEEQKATTASSTPTNFPESEDDLSKAPTSDTGASKSGLPSPKCVDLSPKNGGSSGDSNVSKPSIEVSQKSWNKKRVYTVGGFTTVGLGVLGTALYKSGGDMSETRNLLRDYVKSIGNFLKTNFVSLKDVVVEHPKSTATFVGGVAGVSYLGGTKKGRAFVKETVCAAKENKGFIASMLGGASLAYLLQNKYGYTFSSSYANATCTLGVTGIGGLVGAKMYDRLTEGSNKPASNDINSENHSTTSE